MKVALNQTVFLSQLFGRQKVGPRFQLKCDARGCYDHDKKMQKIAIVRHVYSNRHCRGTQPKEGRVLLYAIYIGGQFYTDFCAIEVSLTHAPRRPLTGQPDSPDGGFRPGAGAYAVMKRY